jgi:EpsI family protein
VLLVLLLLPHASRWALDVSDRAAAPHLSSPPVLSDGWRVAPVVVADFKPDFKNPSADIHTTYEHAGAQVGLYLGYYRQQDYSRKLVSSSNALVKSKDTRWAQVSAGTRQIDLMGQPQRLRSAELRGSPLWGHADAQRLLAWQIYWVNGSWTASDATAKLLGALYRLLGRGDDAAVLILYTPKGRADEGDAVLAAFVQANAPALTALLQQTRAQR